MGRPRRTRAGGLVYHVLNRANRRAQLFADAGDYDAFLRTLADAQAEKPIRLLAYCVLPNHWHLVLRPVADGSLARSKRRRCAAARGAASRSPVPLGWGVR